MTIPYYNLNWLQRGEFVSGSSQESPTTGNLNRPLTQLLDNDKYLELKIDHLVADLASTVNGSYIRFDGTTGTGSGGGHGVTRNGLQSTA